MAGGGGKIQEQNLVVIMTALAVLLIWTGDALYDVYVDHEGSFDKIFFSVTEHEPFLRLFMTGSFLVFGIILSRIIAKLKLTETTMREQAAAIASSMDGIAINNRDGDFLFVNQAYATINGYDRPEEIIGRSYRQAYDETGLTVMDEVCLPALLKTGSWRGELIAKRKNGSTYSQEVSVTVLPDGGRVSITRDITWRKRSEERLRRSEQFLNTIFNSIRDPFCIFDREFTIIRANDAYAQLKGRSVDQLVGMRCFEVLEGRESPCAGCVVERTLFSIDPCVKEKHATLPDGATVWMEIYTYPITDESGNATHIIEYTRDITDRKRAEEDRTKLIAELEHLSRTDTLTGLMNRRAMTESLSYEIDRARRYGSALSLVLFDIDNFKAINDLFGHDAGDSTLRNIADVMRTLVRKSDMAGRYGGDEFMLILPETSETGALHLSEKLLSLVREIRIGGTVADPISISISIGIAALGPQDRHVDHLVKRADTAMYNSKQSGKNRVSTVTG